MIRAAAKGEDHPPVERTPPSATRLANSSGAGGKVRTGRPGALDVISLYLDELLREIGVGGDDPNNPPSPRLRSFLRALLFRVHVPFLFPVDLGGEMPSSTTAPTGEDAPNPQAALPTPPPREEQVQADAQASVTGHTAENQPATAAGDMARSTAGMAKASLPQSDLSTLSSPCCSAASHTRLLGAATVALCLSMAIGGACQSKEDLRRQLCRRLELRRSLESICHHERRNAREYAWASRLLRRLRTTRRAKSIVRNATRRLNRKRHFCRSSRGSFV